MNLNSFTSDWIVRFSWNPDCWVSANFGYPWISLDLLGWSYVVVMSFWLSCPSKGLFQDHDQEVSLSCALIRGGTCSTVPVNCVSGSNYEPICEGSC